MKKSKNRFRLFLAGLVLASFVEAFLSMPVIAQSPASQDIRQLQTPAALDKEAESNFQNSLVPDIPKLRGADPAFDTGDFHPETLHLERPELRGLVTLSDRLDPFNLDAYTPRAVTLKEILETCIESNLDIGIAHDETLSRKWRFGAALGRFLPSSRLSFDYSYLKGKVNLPIGPTPDPLRFDNPFILSNAGFTYYGYRGGGILFGALKERNFYRAMKHHEKATISDALRQSFELYYRLMLEESILRIRIKAVEVSEEQVRLNKNLFEAGSATRLDLMQAETQLSRDRQLLIDQQVKRRGAAIDLADYLNLEQAIDLIPVDLALAKCELIKESTDIGKLIGQAMTSRPELKMREEQRLAAKKEIVVAQSPLHPTVQLDGDIYGIGETLSNSTRTVSTTSTVITPDGGSVTTPVTRNVNRQVSALYTIGVAVRWNLDGLGTKDLALTQAARIEARKAGLEQRKEVNRVISQVRHSYLDMLRTDRQIEEALAQLRSANEEIKLARLRYENGLGKNIDILRAQQDYTDALIRKATAIVNYNIAQANLLRDTGIISIANLTASVPDNLH